MKRSVLLGLTMLAAISANTVNAAAPIDVASVVALRCANVGEPIMYVVVADTRSGSGGASSPGDNCAEVLADLILSEYVLAETLGDPDNTLHILHKVGTVTLDK